MNRDLCMSNTRAPKLSCSAVSEYRLINSATATDGLVEQLPLPPLHVPIPRHERQLHISIPIPVCPRLFLRKPPPNLPYPSPPSREHAILQAIKTLPMNWGQELSGREAKQDAQGKVVFADTMGELEILVEHGAEGERDGLDIHPFSRIPTKGSRFSNKRVHAHGDGLTLSIIYEVGGTASGPGVCKETEGVSRSSKQMPPERELALDRDTR